MSKHTIALVALLSAATAVAAAAQTIEPGIGGRQSDTPADARWTPWLGCWRAVHDVVGTGPRVCVAATGGGITLRTIVSGKIVGEEVRVADGQSRPVQETGCTGVETTQWSATGQRAYRKANASCDREPARRLASVAFLVPGPVWVDVQAVTSADTTNVRVVRYARASDERLPDAVSGTRPTRGLTAPISQGWTTAEVVEASQHLPADAVQAAISEGPARFRLNAASLSHMADGGVDERVIDLIVAMTYPEKFVVDRASSFAPAMPAMPAFGLPDPALASAFGAGALFGCYSPYGWASASYWSGCGYSPYGFQNGAYGPFGSQWIQTTSPSGEASTGDGGGRVVKGRGYVQVRAAETSAVEASSSGGASNGSYGAGSSSGSGSNSGSGSSGASPSGYSGGGGGGAGGGGDRVAVPRPPGH